ncbi:hypothetical protein SAMN05428950_11429 [Sphingomonas sp. OV641]|uniref:hypothetical protein n=1 Tax=Sphingomonas sp. OV641 TaxID=1881068 RepID=UPI0008BD4755|nr:hypothetical protein [Sphingomonas sp. OV641]SEK02709.1 hypothetical protein SAMN05428950_11429 [Sphingomonas sp. OV641]
MHLDKRRPAGGRRAAKMAVGMIALAGLSVQASAATAPSLAQPTPAQAQAVDRAFATAPAPLKADVTAALATLRPYVVTLMCVQDDMATRGLIEKFVGSRGTTMFNGWSGAMSSAKRMRHHDVAGCLSVTRIQNWRRIAVNEFAFNILFTADDSGESYLWQSKVHKEPDGTWLIA